MADVAIIGAGSWGIALAKVLHTNGNKVTVWSIVEDEITMLKEKHEHVQKLPGVNCRKIWNLRQIWNLRFQVKHT